VAVLLAVVSFVLLGLWPSVFGLSRRRFELFYADFTVGALLCSAVAAYTFGSVGSDLGVSDRMLLAGMRQQGFVFAAGFVFNIGNLLLVAAIPLLGARVAFPLSVGVGLAVFSVLVGHAWIVLPLAAGLALIAVGFLLNRRPSRKGMIVAAAAGLCLGLAFPLVNGTMTGDIGLGPYAETLLICIGGTLSTLIAIVYFVNIAIDGKPVPLKTYIRSPWRPHLWGVAGGAMWTLGILCACLAIAGWNSLKPGLAAIMAVAATLVAIGLAGRATMKTHESESRAAARAHSDH